MPAISTPGDESSVEIVVPATRIPSITTFPLLDTRVKSAFEGADKVDPVAVKSPKLLADPPPPLPLTSVPPAVTPSPILKLPVSTSTAR